MGQEYEIKLREGVYDSLCLNCGVVLNAFVPWYDEPDEALGVCSICLSDECVIERSQYDSTI